MKNNYKYKVITGQVLDSITTTHKKDDLFNQFILQTLTEFLDFNGVDHNIDSDILFEEYLQTHNIYSILTEDFVNTHLNNLVKLTKIKPFIYSLIKEERRDITLIDLIFKEYNAQSASDLKELTQRKKHIVSRDKVYKSFQVFTYISLDYSIKIKKISDQGQYFSFKIFNKENDITKEIDFKSVISKNYARTDRGDDKSILASNAQKLRRGKSLSVKQTAKEIFKELMSENILVDANNKQRIKATNFLTISQLDQNLSIRERTFTKGGTNTTIFKVFYREIDITNMLDFDIIEAKTSSYCDRDFQESIKQKDDKTLSLLETEVRSLNYDLFQSL